MRDIEDKEISFKWLALQSIAIVLFMAIAVAALSELNGGDEFKPCNEHEGVNCDK